MEKPSTTKQLVGIGTSHKLFHNEAGVAYVEVNVDKHTEVWPVEEHEYKSLLSRLFFRLTNGVANDKSLDEAGALLSAFAIYEGDQREVSVRVASRGSSIFIDRANPDWNSVGIGLSGWKLFDRPYFTRKPGMLPLPEPQVGGSLKNLRKFVNLTDEQWVLYQAFLVSCLRPNGPYWILVINGQQGSGKSVLSSVTRSLIDPNRVVSQGSFKSEEDLVITAQNSHLVVLDNLSKITDSQADALCRLVSGSGFRTRKHYTNSDENLMQTVNPVVLNGIPNFVSRPDLEDRSLQLWLRPLADRKTEQSFWAEFEEARPSILGGLFSAVSEATRNLDEVEVADDIRMQDSFKWALAAEPALDCSPGDLLKALKANKARRIDEILSNDQLTDLIRLHAESKCKETGSWIVSPKELERALTNRHSDIEIPVPAQLSNHVMRVIPVLADAGVRVKRLERSNKGARYEFSVGSAG